MTQEEEDQRNVFYIYKLRNVLLELSTTTHNWNLQSLRETKQKLKFDYNKGGGCGE